MPQKVWFCNFKLREMLHETRELGDFLGGTVRHKRFVSDWHWAWLSWDCPSSREGVPGVLKPAPCKDAETIYWCD